ncbi:hypothetical protein [Streptomyces xantholiticus]|uniref:Uncharacterized protein n=1 Tax=Streptomyces xantholiticus TaxID=68285 RepID=A0ABV1V117_9ACTN
MRFFPRRIPRVAYLIAGLATALLGALVALGPAPTSATPQPTPTATVRPVAPLPGDDNRDGVIDEDESGWACSALDNRPCVLKGDDNSDGVIDEDESGWACSALDNRPCGTAPRG